MIKMMLTVVIVFTICWLPFNILQVSPQRQIATKPADSF